ncbi:hypothetical protein [Paenibacillus cellulositrophicus]|uniref:hypothetical protein n=1 Tax=Paenibacillus cellulositrophicus TaxID=562959 RepID=UPI00126745E4|nr:hypothetical protein [Paenibacillus cellulositrophicus]
MNGKIVSTYSPSATQPHPSSAIAASSESVDMISYGETEYAPFGNFRGYLDFLISSSCDDESKARFARWRSVISEAEAVCQSGIGEYINVAMVIWLVEITYSDYFKNWDKMADLFNAFVNHFKGLVQRDRNGVGCNIESYKEWL